ncbi:DUF5131 family protein [Micromonospora sp. NPDC006766]|uniref:DUF5131 family protein n=1 Tax=Micromonospora sp. NPDC006766 TaxID=3154778 RepID=UPI0033E1F46A
MTTNIGWTDETWNFLLGCERVSKGCDGCYAITTANIRKSNPNPKIANAYEGLVERRAGRVDWTGRIRVIEDRLHKPLSWRKPRRIFVNSMSDLFHADVPIGIIAEAFAVMALTPQHHYQLLTKRHARMRSVLSSDAFRLAVESWINKLADDPTIPLNRDERRRVQAAESAGAPPWVWPLPNAWIGVSVEDQATANLRIPALLDTPAAVRWISAEPLLGPVDLTRWIPPRTPMSPGDAPATWHEWTWPDWVPAKAREQIESFWSESIGRGPRAWLRNAHTNGAPAFGQRWADPADMGPKSDLRAVGRYIHAWNNIGRIALDPAAPAPSWLDDGDMGYTSFTSRHVREQLGLHWVVVGGETGPGCRPMHPAWARSLRDQCRASAGTKFFFKQWGDHGPLPKVGPDGLYARDPGITVANDGTVYQPGDLAWPDGPRVGEALRAGHDKAQLHAMYRVGQKTAGNELDGEVIEEYPAVLGE